MASSKNKPLRIQWVRSAIGFPSRQGRVVRGLGLRRLQQVVERVDTPQIRGMITMVSHLVKIVPPSPADPMAAVPEYTIVGGKTAKKKPAEPKAALKKEAAAPKKETAAPKPKPAPEAKKSEAKKPEAKPKAAAVKKAAQPASPAAKTKAAKTAKKPAAAASKTTGKTTGKPAGKSKSKPADKSKKKK